MTFIEIGQRGIPLLGLGSGTYYFKGPGPSALNEKLVEMQVEAIKEGFVHIDSAEAYGNDKELRESLREAISKGYCKREDLFITEKYHSGATGKYVGHSASGDPYNRLLKFLEDVDTPYVDLYLLHSPFIGVETHGFDLKSAWKFMQRCKDEGLAKRIGVSNFAVTHLEEIWGTTADNVEVNQIEFSPFLQNQTPGVVNWCQDHGVVVEAYSPLGPLYKGDLNTGPGLEFKKLLAELSAKYTRSETQVLLRWVIEQGIVPVSTTSKKERLQELKGVFGWRMDEEDVERITVAGEKYGTLRQYWKPEYGKYD